MTSLRSIGGKRLSVIKSFIFFFVSDHLVLKLSGIVSSDTLIPFSMSILPGKMNLIKIIGFNPIRPGLFSRSPGLGGGGGDSETWMSKIEANINRLK